jgi:lipid II:glycine glycyltransferase (peptidoglycan interpeptide bridge formation enzyme)
MLITERKFQIFNIANIYFFEEPVPINPINLPNCDVLTYHTYENCGNIDGFYKMSYFTTTIDLKQDIDVIWNKIKRQHKRSIHRAKKTDITITLCNNYKEFHQRYKKFLKLKNYADPSGISIPSLEFMQKYGILFITKSQGKTLGGNLFFHDDYNVLHAFSEYEKFGNMRDKNKLISDSNCYMQWEAMQYFKNMGLINYDLGGLMSDEMITNPQKQGLNYYKLRFGGDIKSRYEYRKFNSLFLKSLFNSWNFLKKAKIFLPEFNFYNDNI